MNIHGKYIKYENYVALEEKCAALSDDNDKAMEAMKQANEAVKLAHSKYSKLAAENAALKSALNDILQPDAAVLEKNHRVRALDAMETPATDAFLAEVRARALDEFAKVQDEQAKKYYELSPGCSGQNECQFAAGQAWYYAECIRKGAAQ
ncbi:hypothetical protein FNN36_15660 [Salmonella enterica]|uniref:Uncharacterized protein n=2 Tax=Salmonella enterica TaxID=28901 RepID=A0A735N7G1_SALET|nr:hypothetical protein [Salmonella enterica]ECG1400866.1 hypothetical protein [Salmonella enterica subsp. enterica serovar Panama str. CFSAN000601]ECI6631043.1 hypothetical protein [Salmonella enterica subsp. enterica serovar Javiana]EDE1736002.1 hypothetical protein [Salmonella enterica subsp. enterica serovar Montevideo]EDE1889010.1 hypothetical protein [Salmonella enterica subsp. enterica serovar Enteritidis]HAE6965796.1 hypothetical protein [Salmonella enterica subsp. enterica serovar Pan